MTIDTSREAVERLLDGVTEGPWAWEENHPLNACVSVTTKSDAGWTIGIATLYGYSDDVPTPTEPDEPWGDHPIRRADARFISASRELVPALLAERDAALAEVARLSTPPDDAEVAGLVAELGEPLVIIEGYSTDYVDTDDVRERMGKAADALTRLSHANAAETVKREAMEHALHALAEACEGEPSEVFEGEIGSALTHAHATLATHAARRKE